MYKPTRHSYEKRMKNQRRKAKAGLLLATTLTAGMAVNPSPAVTGLASYLTELEMYPWYRRQRHSASAKRM